MEILDGALRLATVKPLRRQNAARRVAFKLHDTYGFPLDLTNDVCRERGVAVDEAGFDAAMQHQKDRPAPPASSRWTARWTTKARPPPSRLRAPGRNCKIVALYADGIPAKELKAAERRGGAGHDPVLRRIRRPGGRPGAITAGGARSAVPTRSRSRPTCSATTARCKPAA
jgi:alanyl-tRNA synthetase